MPDVVDQMVNDNRNIHKWRRVILAIADYSATVPETFFGTDGLPIALPAGYKNMGYITTDGISHGYGPWAGEISTRTNGSIIADRSGVVTPFAIINLQERMTFFVQPTEEVYEGMVVGENSRADDMDVNITKEKKLTNMRQSTADNFESMTPSKVLSLEESLEFAGDDECVEVTPDAIRIRKVELDASARQRSTARLKKQNA